MTSCCDFVTSWILKPASSRAIAVSIKVKWPVSFRHRSTDHNKGTGHENIHRKSGAYQLFLRGSGLKKNRNISVSESG